MIMVELMSIPNSNQPYLMRAMSYVNQAVDSCTDDWKPTLRAAQVWVIDTIVYFFLLHDKETIEDFREGSVEHW